MGRNNDYHFITHWRVEGTAREVSDVLGDAADLVRWWPSVYLSIQELSPGDALGVGKVVSLYTKGWLPYTLRWQFTVTESRPGEMSSLEAAGDFVGRGIWTFRQAGTWVDIEYDWKIRAAKPLLRLLSPLMKPIFSANHHWAMAKGEESLRLELARRHAATPEERLRVPAPPGPTTVTGVPVFLGMGALVGAAVAVRRLRRTNEAG
jgi:hypothetical protein